MNARKALAVVSLLAWLPLAANAAAGSSGGIRAEVQRDLAEARKEVRADMAKAQAELDTENLSVGDSLRIGGSANPKASNSLPKGEITPKGDFLIAGKPVAIDAGQRKQLLAHRALVLDIARSGIEVGEQAAMAAIDATDVTLLSLIVGGMTGGLERRIENTTKRGLAPLVQRICGRLPDVYASQERLAASLPAFRPYATLERGEATDCERDMREGLATRQTAKN